MTCVIWVCMSERYNKMNHTSNEGLSLTDFEDPEYMESIGDRMPDFKGWSRTAKEEFLQEKIRQILFQYGRDGLTSTEIADIAQVSEPTARKYLEKLRAIREAYTLKRKANLTLFYPNGQPLQGFGKYRTEDGPHIIEHGSEFIRC